MTFLNENPKLIFDNIKELLVLGVKDRSHPFHTPIFTSNNIENIPNSRIVVLRKFDDINLIINFHTDFRSPKIKEIQYNNNTCFVFYDPKLKIQLKIQTITKINNQNEVTKKIWAKTSLSSRKCYLAINPPGSLTEIPEDSLPVHLKGVDPCKDESEKGFNNFTVVQNNIKTIEWLYLAASGHRRLKINIKKNKISFNWLIP